ncbi:MAG: hypothetical protein ABR881_00800 [Candidatus Sulfotelmatobacter sp.]|jgi:hypothetical protein
MKISLRALGCILSLLIGFGARQLAAAPLDPPAASPVPLLSAEEIVTKMVERNLERARALGAYQGTRVYRLEYRGFPSSRSADMIVEVKYRSPGTKDFSIRSENGSRLIIDRIFKRMLQTEKEALTEENQSRVALNQDNYRFALAGFESMPTGPSYILSVEPRTDNKLLYRGRIWVDAEDFAVVRIEGAPAKNPSFWTKATKIEQVYGKVGSFWLPLSNRSSSEIRLGGHASFTIDYQDYQITAASPLRKQGEFAGYR